MAHTNPLGGTISDTLLGLKRAFGPVPAALVSCAELASIPAFGRCPTGAAAAEFPDHGPFGVNLADVTWPAADVSAQRLAGLPVLGIAAATNGSVQAVEQVRTLLENAYPAIDMPSTMAETSADAQQATTRTSNSRTWSS